MLEQVTDEQLWVEISRNNEKALEVLYHRYFQNLCGFSYNFLKQIQLAEEVVSDLFLQIWLKRKELTVNSNLKSYLFIATRNLSLNVLKRERNNLEDMENVSSSEIPQVPPITEEILYKEFESEIESLICTLPNQRQIIFRLNRFEGLKYKEIAEILSISPSTVQNQMVAAVSYLASQYPKLAERWQSALSFLLVLFP